MQRIAKRFIPIIMAFILAFAQLASVAAAEYVLISTNNLQTRTSKGKLCWNMAASTFAKSYNSFVTDGNQVKTFKAKEGKSIKHSTTFDDVTVSFTTTSDGYIYNIEVLAKNFEKADSDAVDVMSNALAHMLLTLFRGDGKASDVVNELVLLEAPSSKMVVHGTIKLVSSIKTTDDKGMVWSVLATPYRPKTTQTATAAPTQAPSSNITFADVREEPAPTPTPAPVATQKPIVATDDHTGTVYITPTGKKYHRATCYSIQDSDVSEIQKEDAKLQGYSACKICHPGE